MTITAEPASEAIGARPCPVRVREFDIYRDGGDSTGFESTGDLWIRNGHTDFDTLAVRPEGKVAVILGSAVDDHSEVLVDDHHDAVTQLDRAIFHLTAARNQLAAMLDSEAVA